LTANYTITAIGGAVITKTVTLIVPCDSSLTINDPGRPLSASFVKGSGTGTYVLPAFTTSDDVNCPVLSYVASGTGITQSICSTDASVACQTVTLPTTSIGALTATYTITATGGAVITKTVTLTV